MMFRYEVRTLASLPWPHGLGKGEFSKLRDAMEGLLEAEYGDPAADERAFATNDRYREIAVHWLSKADWSGTVVEVVTGATRLAAGVNILGHWVEEDRWRDRAKAICDANGVAHGDYWNGGPYASGDYLISPGISVSERGMADGRHRLTYLRLMERAGLGPSEILVKVWP